MAHSNCMVVRADWHKSCDIASPGCRQVILHPNSPYMVVCQKCLCTSSIADTWTDGKESKATHMGIKVTNHD